MMQTRKVIIAMTFQNLNCNYIRREGGGRKEVSECVKYVKEVRRGEHHQIINK